jgi:hypothetical protein
MINKSIGAIHKHIKKELVNSGMVYLIHCKNFCKYPNVPSSNTTVNKKKELVEIKMNVIDDVVIVPFMLS